MMTLLGAGIARIRHLATAVLLAPILAVALPGCSDALGGDEAAPPPRPLLYEIASADGVVEGWMLGTIHALPGDTDWRNPAIMQVIADADLLVVEIAGLNRGSSVGQAFAELAMTPGLPPLNQRVPADLAPKLAALMQRGGLEPGRFTATDTWAAAIALAQIDATGDPEHGADRALLRDFADRRVRELEGARGQLAIFDRLPEDAQRAMLAAVVRGNEAARKDPARLQRAWLAGDAATIEQSTREGFLADPVLREALLTARNRRWLAALVPALEEQPRPLIAVGAAHLVGSDGLASLLAAQGYRVRRLP